MALFGCLFVLAVGVQWTQIFSYDNRQLEMEDVGPLLVFKEGMLNDPHQTLSNWNPNDYNPCNWTGVSCTPGTSRVNRLCLQNRNLTGRLGAELAELTHLQYLNLSGNALTGGIPPELGRLKALMVLDLSFNQLGAHIPIELGQCAALEVLNISSNNISGSIPASLGGLTNLTSLQIKEIVNLTGEIPRELGNLKNLQLLHLWKNNLRSEIPVELGELDSLRDLQLGLNQLTGAIPTELGKLKNLQMLGLGSNKLTGQIPAELGKLENLRALDLSANNLSGGIPIEVGRLQHLQYLYLEENNHLSGNIPSVLGQLRELEILYIHRCNLSGNIPFQMGQLRSLQILGLALNQLTGGIPKELGQLQNLTELYLGDNNLNGSIPSELCQLKLLTYLYLRNNSLTGHIPPELGQLSVLKYLTLSRNQLTGGIPKELGHLKNLAGLYLTSNKLNGSIPSELCHLKLLSYLLLRNNSLTGEIPSELNSMKQLVLVSVSTNKLTGKVPQFEDLQSLEFLDFGHNLLTGPLPKSWGRTNNLRVLILQDNSLEGELPAWIWKLSKLQTLVLSNNLFSGRISSEISQLQALQGSVKTLASAFDRFGNSSLGDTLNWTFKGHSQVFPQLYKKEGFLDFSNNQLGGRIPIQIGFLQGIRGLNLSGNKLVGHIPPSLGNISTLESLDLSNNSLDGPIPKELLNLNFLEIINMSYNNLTGFIPTGRQFNTFQNSSYIGNINLCGYPLSKLCGATNRANDSTQKASHEKAFSQKKRSIAIILPIAGILLVLSFIFWLYYKQNAVSPDVEMCHFEEGLKVKSKDLFTATNGYCHTSIIGTGASSTVYKGTLANGQLVAIKKLRVGEQAEEVERCFVTECKTLAKIRHRNLVKILGAISDYNTKILVLQYMSNGSLDMHLHNPEVCLLTWETRVKIALGMARALVYLHEESGIGQIVHCDLKPSNILLDQDFEAHVNDFGISRLIDPGMSSSTLSSTFKGSIGYIAPEFAHRQKVSPKADVYSYGVVLLEMITRKAPTSSAFVGGISLVEWVRSSFPETTMEVVDDALRANATITTCKQISSVISLALLCTQAAPNDRPSMREVLAILGSINGNHYQPFTSISSEYMRGIIFENNRYNRATATSDASTE